ncbi:hypothetical protein B5X24_HaOG201007 [Helicoverpa armigera]|nr:hypothetical protein B5X24_HaOG201007 [Helicoverpa armigera]
MLKSQLVNSLNNFIDKDLQSMLLPLSLMQNFTFCPKFRIKNNRITPISYFHKFVAFVGTVMFIYFYVLRVYIQSFEKIFKNDFFELYTCCYCSFGIAINFIDSIIQTKLYVNFVLLIQKVHRLLNDEHHFRFYVISNWLRIIAVYGFFIIILIEVSVWIQMPYYYIASCYPMVAFDLNLVYAISLITLLKDKIILWDIHVSNLQAMQEENEPKKMYQTYVNILKCYEIYATCFERNVSGFFLVISLISLFLVLLPKLF